MHTPPMGQGAAWQPTILSSNTLRQLEGELDALVQHFESTVRTLSVSGEQRAHEATKSVLTAAMSSSVNMNSNSNLNANTNTNTSTSAAPNPSQSQLLKRARDAEDVLAVQSALRSREVVAQIRRMKGAQIEFEKQHSAQRVLFLEGQERRRAEMFAAHSARLKAVRSQSELDSTQLSTEREFAELEAAFRGELLRRDQAVIDDLNARAKAQQRALTELRVPGFSVTDDPREVSRQMDILRLIVDEIDKDDVLATSSSSSTATSMPISSSTSILSHTLLTELQLGSSTSDEPPSKRQRSDSSNTHPNPNANGSGAQEKRANDIYDSFLNRTSNQTKPRSNPQTPAPAPLAPLAPMAPSLPLPVTPPSRNPPPLLLAPHYMLPGAPPPVHPLPPPPPITQPQPQSRPPLMTSLPSTSTSPSSSSSTLLPPRHPAPLPLVPPRPSLGPPLIEPRFLDQALSLLANNPSLSLEQLLVLSMGTPNPSPNLNLNPNPNPNRNPPQPPLPSAPPSLFFNPAPFQRR